MRKSPKAWYETFDKCVSKLGFIRSNYDYCLYVNNTDNDTIYILVFVDDLLICCRNKDRINEVKSALMKRFVMKDLGKIKSYIRIGIDYNNKKGIMT